MNVQLKEGQSYLNEANQYEYNSGFGRVRNLNLVIISGEMSEPGNFRAQAAVHILFYKDKAAMVAGSQPLYIIDIPLRDSEVINILDIDPEAGYSINEKKIYDWFLTLYNYSELFEIV